MKLIINFLLYSLFNSFITKYTKLSLLCSWSRLVWLGIVGSE
jgi:hypothetical protein